jgi:signal transduction histidine kinase
MRAEASVDRRGVARRLLVAHARITFVATMCAAAVLAVVGVGVASEYRARLVERIDGALHGFEDIVQRAEDKGTFPTTFGPGSGSDDDDDDRFSSSVPVQIVDDHGTVLFASGVLEDEPPLAGPDQDTHDIRTVRARTGDRLRVITVDLEHDNRQLVMGLSLHQIDDDVRSLRRVLLVGLPLALVGFALVTWFSVRRSLRPVTDAVEREEQLFADVSHELRNPLGSLRLLLETEPGEAPAIAETRQQALASVGRLEGLVSQLLVLARHGATSRRPAAPVDLDEIVLEEAARLQSGAPVPIHTDQVEGGQVIGSVDELRSIVGNLLSNAVRHARSRVDVAVQEVDDLVTMRVDDDGPGIPARDRERIFDRFARLDDARDRDTGGSGLGLAIVRQLTDAHGGTVTVGTAPSGGASFIVILPASVARR